METRNQSAGIKLAAGIRFTKMHGLGNDFVVINTLDQTVSPEFFAPHAIQVLANRHFGVGCDQVLVIEKSTESDIDFNYRIFNSDGSEVGQCGNGARCLAKFIHDKKLSTKKQLRVKTLTRVLELNYQSDQEITINMGLPAEIQPIQVEALSGIKLSIGNPHAVFGLNNMDEPLNNLGLNHLNVGFMKIMDRNHIKLRVFERGVGETQACGSGACAAVVAGIYQKQLNNTVTVELLGGTLVIHWSGDINVPVMMTGSATTVFEGIYL